MHDWEKSDPAIVAAKPANASVGAELVEPRVGAEGNTARPDTFRTQSRADVSHGLDRVRQVAKAKTDERFTALLHHLDIERLRDAYWALQRQAAPGVDGRTWTEYGEDLDRNLLDLHARVHRGTYRALPSRRQYIPKPDGRQRPLGVAAIEDKIVQRALVEVLNAIYEEDFLGLSYGFRPGRSQHDALDALAAAITGRAVNWILDTDIRSFFDTLDHEVLEALLSQRIADPRVQRLIHKWLKAGVLEDGEVLPTEQGSPQGAVISPLLANICLHYVFDTWAHQWRQEQAHGTVTFVRYADDIVAGFEHEEDARRFQAALAARLAEHGLDLHPDKTRLIEFGRQAAANRQDRGQGKPETFDFLGFTHICGRNRRGGFQLKRKSRRDRMTTKVKAIKQELKRRMHQTIAEQGRWLAAVVKGYFAYHAVPTNFRSLKTFRLRIMEGWLQTLRRRSQRDTMTWERLAKIADEFLPKPRIIHKWPDTRFAAKHPRWEPDARIGLVRFCAGGAQ